MSGTCLEPTSRGINTAKVIIVLSLLLPYVVDWLNEEGYHMLAIYAPTWIFLSRESYSYFGPTSIGFLMIFQWFPYVYVGYQSYRFAQGQYSRMGWYVGGVAFVTLIAIMFTLPMMMTPRASGMDFEHFSIVIPLPLVSILALVLIPLLRPNTLTSSWDDVTQDVFSQDESANPFQDSDTQE